MTSFRSSWEWMVRGRAAFLATIRPQIERLLERQATGYVSDDRLASAYITVLRMVDESNRTEKIQAIYAVTPDRLLVPVLKAVPAVISTSLHTYVLERVAKLAQEMQTRQDWAGLNALYWHIWIGVWRRPTPAEQAYITRARRVLAAVLPPDLTRYVLRAV